MQSWIICSNKVHHLGRICFHGYQHRLERCSLHGLVVQGKVILMQVGGSVSLKLYEVVV